MVIQTKGMKMEKLYRQVGDELIEYTDEEYAQAKLDAAEAAKNSKEIAATQAKKAELLEKLGITAEEAKLLLA
jgi:hypothetical protein